VLPCRREIETHDALRPMPPATRHQRPVVSSVYGRAPARRSLSPGSSARRDP
jgi:hypothetical protein